MPLNDHSLKLENRPDDAALMAAVAGGDMQAFAQLVDRHQDRVRRIACRVTGRWDVADDVAQEAFLRVLRSAGSYKPTAALTTWLYRIVINLCLDWSRRPRLAEVSADEPDTEAGAGQQLQDRERREAVQREIAALPDRQRVALVLHRFEGLTHAQIAQATGWSEGAIESLLVRAYARLRENLKNWAAT